MTLMQYLGVSPNLHNTLPNTDLSDGIFSWGLMTFCASLWLPLAWPKGKRQQVECQGTSDPMFFQFFPSYFTLNAKYSQRWREMFVAWIKNSFEFKSIHTRTYVKISWNIKRFRHTFTSNIRRGCLKPLCQLFSEWQDFLQKTYPRFAPAGREPQCVHWPNTPDLMRAWSVPG